MCYGWIIEFKNKKYDCRTFFVLNHLFNIKLNISMIFNPKSKCHHQHINVANIASNTSCLNWHTIDMTLINNNIINIDYISWYESYHRWHIINIFLFNQHKNADNFEMFWGKTVFGSNNREVSWYKYLKLFSWKYMLQDQVKTD